HNEESHPHRRRPSLAEIENHFQFQRRSAGCQGDAQFWLLAAAEARVVEAREKDRTEEQEGADAGRAFAGAAGAAGGLAAGGEVRWRLRHRRRRDAGAVLADLVGPAEAVRDVVAVREAGGVDLAVAVVVEAVALLGRRADGADAIAPPAVGIAGAKAGLAGADVGAAADLGHARDALAAAVVDDAVAVVVDAVALALVARRRAVAVAPPVVHPGQAAGAGADGAAHLIAVLAAGVLVDLAVAVVVEAVVADLRAGLLVLDADDLAADAVEVAGPTDPELARRAGAAAARIALVDLA